MVVGFGVALLDAVAGDVEVAELVLRLVGWLDQ